MRVSLTAISACELGTDTFVYLPKKKMFFFCDDFDHIDDKVILYFEQDIDVKNGALIETKVTLNANETIFVVSNYNVTPKLILEDKRTYYQGELSSAEGDFELGDDDAKAKVDNIKLIIEGIDKEIDSLT